MPDLSRREKRVHARDHAEPRAQYGHNGYRVFRYHALRALFERRLNLHFLRRRVLERLVGQERRYLLDKLAEILGVRFYRAKYRYLMIDERMVEHGDVFKLLHLLFSLCIFILFLYLRQPIFHRSFPSFRQCLRYPQARRPAPSPRRPRRRSLRSLPLAHRLFRSGC